MDHGGGVGKCPDINHELQEEGRKLWKRAGGPLESTVVLRWPLHLPAWQVVSISEGEPIGGARSRRWVGLTAECWSLLVSTFYF